MTLSPTVLTKSAQKNPTHGPLTVAPDAPLIELRQVSKSYATASGPAVTILDDVNLQVLPGEMLGLLGQSGELWSIVVYA